MKKMLFAELDLPLIDKLKTAQWLSEVSENYWLFDTYRQCFMLPLMTRNGKIKKSDMLQHNVLTDIIKFSWTNITPNFIKAYFEKNIFNWTKTKSRIVVIKTPSRKQNPVHIDCFPHTFNTIQHKLRIVVQGTSNSLYFETRKGKIWAPFTEKPFIMDGSWPHGMINNSNLCKYTICFGSPWTQSDYYPRLNALISLTRKELPENYSKYFRSIQTEELQ